ncbi:MAG TPA: hypothetical protein VF943_03660 [Burkholderiales bacterium]
MNLIRQITKIGWIVVEVAFLLVVLCVLLNIILGKEGGGFVSSVAANALDFLQKVPSGTFLGIFLILVVYRLVKSKAKDSP